jgi:ribosomal protein S18 acetylase RimI-like enzyme
MAAMSANFLAFVRAQAAGPLGRLEEDDDWLVAETGLPCLNRVSLKRPVPADALTPCLDRLSRHFAGRTWYLVVQPAAGDGPTGRALEAAGMRLARDMPVMHVGLGSETAGPAAALVRDAAGLAEWQGVAASAYRLEEDGSGAALGLLAAMAALPGCRFWLRRSGGEAVACAFSLECAGTAGLYWVATVPEYRGQGHASALVAGVMAALARNGVGGLYLQASELGLGLYRTLGFRGIGRLHVWEAVMP